MEAACFRQRLKECIGAWWIAYKFFLEAAYSMGRVLIIDTETTGFTDPVEPIEIAWVCMHAESLASLDDALSISESFESRYKPDGPISYGAMATHHITNEDLEGCPHHSTFSLPPDTLFLVGHNIDYDWNVIGQPEVPRICTLALARRLWPDDLGHSLGAMMYRLASPHEARELLKNAHSAYHDVLMTHILLRKIMGRMPKVRTWQRLWEASERARIPVIMPFGKHKGMPIADLPQDYCDWLLRQSDMDHYLLQAIRLRGS